MLGTSCLNLVSLTTFVEELTRKTMARGKSTRIRIDGDLRISRALIFTKCMMVTSIAENVNYGLQLSHTSQIMNKHLQFTSKLILSL